MSTNPDLGIFQRKMMKLALVSLSADAFIQVGPILDSHQVS